MFFPTIIHIDKVLMAIAGKDEFFVKHDEALGYKVINYMVNMEDTFPPVTDENSAILRECRGLVFCAKTGVILSRRYHKFFNLNEREESSIDKIDLIEPHDLLEKLDGSMITPLVLNGKVHWATKMGVTDVAQPVAAFVQDKEGYEKIARDFHEANLTPIFEWCSRKQRIVIDYPEDQLILTAIRDTRTGGYVDYETLKDISETYNVPVVRRFSNHPSRTNDLLTTAKSINGFEGYVLRFYTGHMYKIKADEYVRLHKAKDTLNMEKNVLRVVVDGQADDLIASLAPLDAERVRAYSDRVLKELTSIAFWLTDDYKQYKLVAGDNKKDFALMILERPDAKLWSSIFFKMWNGVPALEAILAHVRKYTDTGTNVAKIRDIIRTTWDYTDTSVE